MIPRPLLDDIVDGKCLPFIGAGFSKNAEPLGKKMMPGWTDLTKELAKDLDTDLVKPLEITQKYETTFGRPKLIERIREILSVNEFKPGKIHQQLTKIKSFDIIYTTNFDSLIEDAYKQENCQVKTTVGNKQFSEFAGKIFVNVIKMHGDLNASEYMVITKEDYEKYFENYDAFVIHLYGQLMTRTLLFIGYSLTDPNFQLIKHAIEEKFGKSVRKGYIVLFNASDDEIKKYEEMKLHVINLESTTKSRTELLCDFFNEIIQYESPQQIVRDLEISTNKKILVHGENLEIKIRVKNLRDKPLNLQFINEAGEIIKENQYELSNNESVYSLVLEGKEWKLNSNYLLVAEYADHTDRDEFYISESFNVVVQTDKSVYIQGSDMILTIINPNAIVGIPINVQIVGPNGLVYKNAIPVNPNGNGIYQEVILVDGKNWSRFPGSEYEIVAEYGGQDARLNFYTSNFGASVELDQKVYTWTDKVYITVVAPDFNRNSEKPDSIFVMISTTKGQLSNYRLIETGNDTGIFTGEVILTGFKEGQRNVDNKTTEFGIIEGFGPTNGKIASSNVDVVTISFKFAEDEVVVGSAFVRWNIGEISWLKSNYKIGEEARVRVVDPDMNLDPNKIDSFKIKVYSDSDPTGIEISVHEISEASGIFEGMIKLDEKRTEGNMVKASNGDCISAVYVDKTLPSPYTDNDYLVISGTAIVSDIISKPLEKHQNAENVIRILKGSSSPHGGKYLDKEIITIKAGEKIRWVNDDSAAHTITSGDLNADPDNIGIVFDSSLFMGGKSFEVTFHQHGEYPYFDLVCPWIVGKIVVE